MQLISWLPFLNAIGKERIRTAGRLPYDGFQNHYLKPDSDTFP